VTVRPEATTSEKEGSVIMQHAQKEGVVEGDSLTIIKDSVASIKKSALRFLSGTALSRVSGMIRDVMLANAFGTSSAIAAFFVAYRLSQLCRRLFGEGALQSAFIPLFEQLRKDKPERAFLFFRDLSALVTIFLFAFVILSMIGLGITKQLFDWSPGNQEIITLMIILMPSLIPICLFGVNSSLLQCQKHYFSPGIAPAFFNIAISIAAFLLKYFELSPQEAMPYVAVATIFGCALQWGATVPVTLRHVKNALNGKIFHSIRLFSPDIRLLGAPLALGLLGVGASQINNGVDALFARYSDPEGPAQLWFGLRLLQLPLALFGIAISGALLPPLSRAIQSGNKKEYLHFLEFALRRVTAFLLPCTVILYVMGTHIINAIYAHGDFTTHSIFTTSGCLHGYAIGLLPMGFIIVLAPAFYALKDYRTPTIGAILSLVVNLVLNAFMVFVLEWKALSVALATSISSWINIAYLYRKLENHSGKILSDEGAQEFFKVVSVSLLAGALTWIIQTRFFVPASFFQFFGYETDILPTNLHDQIMSVVTSGLTFLGSTLLFAWLMKADDMLALFNLHKKTPPSQETIL
jgi:putative peptidoglycan lipid II flippase